MRFDILTIFPHIFDSYFGESILKRARESGKIDIAVHNIRDYATDKHKTTDDIPYGGGAGMVLKVQPIFDALNVLERQEISNKVQVRMDDNLRPTTDYDPRPTTHDQPRDTSNSQPWITDNLSKTQNDGDFDSLSVVDRRSNVRILLFSAKGKKFTQRDAERLAKYDRLIMICGRYEGVDERVAEHLVDEEFSIGEYVLTGGEIPAMVLVDSVSRLLPGVLGNEESLREESYNTNEKLKMKNEELKMRDLGWIPASAGMTGKGVDGEMTGVREEDTKEECLPLPEAPGQARGAERSSEIKDFENVREYPQYTRPEEFNGWKVPEVLLSGNHKEIEKWRNSKRS